jgi:carboxyl-terminal processing protease
MMFFRNATGGVTRRTVLRKNIPMNDATHKRPTPIPRVTAALAVLALVSACAAPHGAQTPADQAFHEAEAIDVFDVGYANIRARALDPVAPRLYAVEGLRGLSAIDPALSVDDAGASVRILRHGREIAREPAPVGDDASAWARVTSRLIAETGRASDPVRLATAERIFESVFDGAISELDLYSRYAGADEARRNRAKRDGFGGIGVRFQREDDAITVTHVTGGTPADGAGLKVGDRLLAVDGAALTGLTLADVVDLLRGPVGSTVDVIYARRGTDGPVSVAIDRAHIVPQTVAERRADGIVFFKIDSFNQDTARTLSALLQEARDEMGPTLRGVVLDLRGNPGGLLRQSVEVADVFLANGRIVSTRGRHPDSHQIYDAETGDQSAGTPLVVLVDGKSASAAEIVASALSDRARAVVIGTSSYGKGTVQTVIRLPNDGELTLTWSRLISPNGHVLHGHGVVPAVCTSHVKGALSAEAERSALEAAARASLAAFGHADMERRRADCPSERRDDDLEIRLARKLLDHPDIYARLRQVPAATAQALPGS